MPDYEKMYHLLFNAITDALTQLEAQNYGDVNYYSDPNGGDPNKKPKKSILQQRIKKEANLNAANAAMPPWQASARSYKSKADRN